MSNETRILFEEISKEQFNASKSSHWATFEVYHAAVLVIEIDSIEFEIDINKIMVKFSSR